MHIECFNHDGAFPIKLIQTGKDKFTVIYGVQVEKGLTYVQAAKELGLCIMHSCACEGTLTNDTKD